MSEDQKPFIAIVGGGLGGLTLSIGLSRHGVAHKIYESARKFAEIGAGIALGPNSITALELIDPGVKAVFDSCVSYNERLDSHGEGPGKSEWLDLRCGEEENFNKLITTVVHNGSKPGRACVHRARFLEGLSKLIDPATTIFDKTLASISDLPSGQVSLSFGDGTTVVADAVIACDGIKSVARQTYVLKDISDVRIARPAFANDFAYRGLFTRERFLEIVGDRINVGKGTYFCGPDSYVVMYPVEKNSMMNVVAIKHVSTDAASRPDEKNWIEDVSHDTMLSDFEGWGRPILALLKEIGKPQRWALYDHLPAPTYVKRRVALMGDSAHATTPHQGQGAGMAFEDSYILSNILGELLSTEKSAENHSIHQQSQTANLSAVIESCFIAYDNTRRSRTQEVTRTSREMGAIAGYAGEGIGRDLQKIKANADTRMHWIWDVDLPGEVMKGIILARRLLDSSRSHQS